MKIKFSFVSFISAILSTAEFCRMNHEAEDCVEQENNAELFYKRDPSPTDITYDNVCFANVIKPGGKRLIFWNKKDTSSIILAPASCIRGPDDKHRDPLRFRALVDFIMYTVIDKFEYDGDESDANEIKEKYTLVKVRGSVPFTETFRPTCVTDDRIKRWAKRFSKKPSPDV